MEELILQVRNYPCLWDTNSVFFRDVARKNAAWEAVLEECGGIGSVSEAKALWKRLRDCHREAMRRRKSTQGLAPWKYEEAMEFLLPPNSNVEYQNENDDASVSEEEEKITLDTENTDSRNLSISTKTHKRESFLDNIEEREKRRVENERRRTEHRHHTIDMSRNANDDGLKDLFSGLCQKTARLPKHLQLRVQREIFDAVMRAEEEAYRLQCTSSSGFEGRRSSIKEAEIDVSLPKTIRIKKESGEIEDMILITN